MRKSSCEYCGANREMYGRRQRIPCATSVGGGRTPSCYGNFASHPSEDRSRRRPPPALACHLLIALFIDDHDDNRPLFAADDVFRVVSFVISSLLAHFLSFSALVCSLSHPPPAPTPFVAAGTRTSLRAAPFAPRMPCTFHNSPPASPTSLPTTMISPILGHAPHIPTPMALHRPPQDFPCPSTALPCNITCPPFSIITRIPCHTTLHPQRTEGLTVCMVTL